MPAETAPPLPLSLRSGRAAAPSDDLRPCWCRRGASHFDGEAPFCWRGHLLAGAFLCCCVPLCSAALAGACSWWLPLANEDAPPPFAFGLDSMGLLPVAVCLGASFADGSALTYFFCASHHVGLDGVVGSCLTLLVAPFCLALPVETSGLALPWAASGKLRGLSASRRPICASLQGGALALAPERAKLRWGLVPKDDIASVVPTIPTCRAARLATNIEGDRARCIAASPSRLTRQG